MKYFKYLLEKETSEIVVILLLFLSIVITPPPIVSAFLFTLIFFFLACFTKRIGHFMGAMVAAEAEKNIPARSDYFLNVVTG